ncbi:hypothetical protein [Bartonella sp. ML70XJBT]|uniref:hypothetical protein n=1 Tax=Bartonella sp. ML70XJBT TaxID=3019096 RepID=UPI00235F6677|nr:hypothetical protein [Bartonella sp. ML70XJBT]
MSIKKTLFRSVLIITLFTTYFISPSNGYANSNEFFCSKEIIERESAIRDYMSTVDLWWERILSESVWLERTSHSEKNAKLMEQWYEIISQRRVASRQLIFAMTNEITEIKDLNKERESKNHGKASEILERISIIQTAIDDTKKEVEKLDSQLEMLYQIIHKINK